MQRTNLPPGAQASLGDRAVAIAAILAVVVVGLFGGAPDRAPEPAARTARSAHR